MKVWCVFMDVSYFAKQAAELSEISKDGNVLVQQFDNLKAAALACESLNSEYQAQIRDKLVSQCGYPVERAMGVIASLTPRYFVEEKTIISML